ncbi:MAG: CHRD domain-containing protein [Fodinibius sp.]|nr:CHRD domain-containing protein [Fodinibius sp.]
MKKGLVITVTAMVLTFLIFPEPTQAQQKQRIILAGYKHKPPVPTTGSGMVTVSFKNDTLTVDGSFEELTSQYSGGYLMVSLRGESGNQLYNLKADLNEQKTGGTFKPADNTFALTKAEIKLLKNGEMYINISSFDNQRGELRGNISAMN